MLRLLYAIACENVIIADNGVTSLIGILEKVEADVPSSAPEKIMVPMKWNMIVLWTRDDNPVKKPTTFEQQLLVTSPSGERVFTVPAEFVVSDKHTNFRNVTELQGFPIETNGKLLIEVQLREKGQDEWTTHFVYSIITERRIVEQVNDNKNEIGSKNDAVTSVA